MSRSDQSTEIASRIGDVLVSISSHIPQVQARLDASFLRDSRDYSPILEMTRNTPFEQLGLATQPAPVSLTRVNVSVQLTFGKTVENEMTVRFLNAQFQSRYGSSSQMVQKLDLTVLRVPWPAGADVPLTSPLEDFYE
jgi:hypothetical protein